LDLNSIFIVLIGSTFGLILRIFIQNNFKKNIGFDIQNTSIVNFIASFFLGILVALNFTNNEILLLFNQRIFVLKFTQEKLANLKKIHY